MKKVLRSFVAVAMLAVAAFAAGNVENPLYAPAQLDFYSKTGFGWMYKKSDDNLAMKAKNWANETENPIFRIYEDFGFGITNRFAIRGAFGYTYDGDINRKGPHNARLGLNYRAINLPAEAVVWDIYADAWLGGISKMNASLVAAEKPQVQKDGTPYVLTFNYDNYGNGRWGAWFGTMVGKTFDKLTLSAFGEAQVTYGNSNNQIKITESAKAVVNGMVKKSVMPLAIQGACAQAVSSGVLPMTVEQCMANTPAPVLAGADVAATGITNAYVAGLPDDFSVDTKGTVDYTIGLKTLYEINNDWSMGGGFAWKHHATNSVEAVNIVNTSKVPDEATVAKITQGVADSFVGSMEDGFDEFTLTLLGSRQLTDNLQLTLYGEYTFDVAEEKAQLGTNRKAEAGLRLNLQF
jgi:hypothetical protein